MNNKNIYKEFAPRYIDNGMSVIPDKYMQKLPAIRAWSDYCYKKPTEAEVESWSNNFNESNISIALGEASGVIAIDVDTEDEEILAFIRKELYPSPCEKVGSKGFTRFYKYTGEISEVFKHNKNVVFELLSSKKKSTLPPSVHPTGSSYKWSGKSLLDFKPEELPVLPPFLVGRLFKDIIDMFPEDEVNRDSYSKFSTSGRNDTLTKMCFKLIGEKKSADEVVKELVDFDKKEHSPPYFTDPEENMHLDAYSNALAMYSYQINRLNAIHHKKCEEYETVQLASAINSEYNEAVALGKSQAVRPPKEKKLKSQELSLAPIVKRTCPCCSKEKR